MPDITTSPGFDEIVVGFEDETENITRLLIREPKELDVVSITGMAGLGKTTLARKVFCHKPVIDWFHFRVWCCVSLEYDKNRVFHEIFSQVADDMSVDDTDEVVLEILMKKCQDEQSWVDTAEALRMALRGKCKGHKIRDDTTEVLYESLIKMSEDDNSWKKISSTLHKSIMGKCENTKNWDDIAKPLYESLIVNFEDNNVRDDATEMSPKFPVERHKDIKMWKKITSAISQSKIIDKKDIRRTDDEVQKLFKSLQDLAEVLFKNINENFQENDSWKEMLETLFKSLNDIVETLLISLNKKCKDSKSWDDNIAEKLRKKLLGQRYLIVLDDVWRKEAWDELSRAFPLGTEGSRIILTSREYEVGKYARSGADHHSLRFFTTEESQDLLQLKLSKKNVGPPELKEFGRQIAERCGGVPLVVVLVAGILQKRIEEKYFSWDEFLQSLSSHIRGDESRSMDVIALSYKHLPEHLKPCLLYFGAFPEDYEIPVSKLIQLWMAEGFVKQIEKKVPEDEGEDYLNHLIGSNLIMVSTRGYNGSVRTCRIHDLVGSFCLTKAKNDKFLMQTDSEQSSPHSELTSTYDRFCLLKRNEKYLSPDSAMLLNPRLGTLLCFSSHNPNLSTHSLFARDVDPSSGLWVASTFKLVRVLDLESVFVGTSFLSMVEFLLCLRYLAICLKGQGSVRQPSLERLHHLETFKVKSSVDLHLPFMIWNIEGLRHLHIDHYCYWCFYRRNSFSIPPKPLNLQTFSFPVLFNTRKEEHLLRKLPHLKKLRCRLSMEWYKNCNRFPELGYLDQLESLEVCDINDHMNASIHTEFDFPPNLKELTLHKFRLPWDCISVIADLTRLESLELFAAFDGEQWDVDEGKFRKLKFLRICKSRIVRWNATAESFPKLKRLILAKCRHLEEVPFEFQDSTTLEVIEIDQCNSSVARSVKKIQEGMEGLGNENLNVRIMNSDLELGSLYL
ncbi:PREDICTED: putative late blight resistance protein homolog R1B-14 [Ipomoea nil]|uniref:putative late blight resistance protein homolog R1B-14 n=1 Tax=Ipomoea nil TaxID=35883 RepID=UPI00090092DA|nr:PREDICTED: putative late blight resistance protein homolog R1B-14 [Ipomoea nil]